MTHSDKRSYYFKIDTTVKRIRSFMQKGLAEGGIGLTVDQWVVIDHIRPKAGINQNDLAVDTAKDAPTVTRILDILAEKGLVRRQMADEDRRKFNVYLTEAGEELHEKALGVIGEIRKKSWGTLTDEDYEHLVRIMDKIHDNVSKK